jgi:hypothetical protein
VVAVLALGACNKTQGEGAGTVQAEGAGVVARVRQQLRSLEQRYGEDAYDRPEALALNRELEALGSDSPEHLQALELLDFLRAKQRLAIAARQGTPPQRQNVPNYGPVRMEGAPPASQADLERVGKIKVGSTREELVTAFGSCLVRQTWFPGRKGNPTVELFHVGPDCRDKLTQKIYRVSAGSVDQIQEGNLDSTMPPTTDPDGTGGNTQPLFSEEEAIRMARERQQQQGTP